MQFVSPTAAGSQLDARLFRQEFSGRRHDKNEAKLGHVQEHVEPCRFLKAQKCTCSGRLQIAQELLVGKMRHFFTP